jgi:fructoselysine 6-phosphate deglycase
VGDNSESLISLFMLMMAMVGGVMKGRDGWALGDKLLSSLAALPAVVGSVAQSSDARGLALAGNIIRTTRSITSPRAPASCRPIISASASSWKCSGCTAIPSRPPNFSGPFEILDDNTPFILIVGEDPSRPLMERVMAFCEKHGRRIMTFDSRDFDMPGIDPEIRPILAPHIIQTALKRFSEHLSDLRGQPLSTRRYMWKMAY